AALLPRRPRPQPARRAGAARPPGAGARRARPQRARRAARHPRRHVAAHRRRARRPHHLPVDAVTRTRTILAGPALTLVALVAACPAEEPCTPAWEVELDQPGGTLLAGWGRAPDDAWMVGGGLGSGPARIVRWTGQPAEAAAAL